MIIWISIFLYFLFMLILVKISNKLNLMNQGFKWLLFIFPPFHFLYLTKYFLPSLSWFVAAYVASYFLEQHWITWIELFSPYLIPLTISVALISYRLKASQYLAIINVIPPFLWSFFILYYLAFFYTVEYEDDKIEE